MSLAAETHRRNDRILIYDAECRLCVGAKERLERVTSEVRFVPYQSAEAASRLGAEYRPGRPSVAYLVEPDGMIRRGVDAFAALTPPNRGGRVLAALLRVPGMRSIAHGLYRLIARYRYRWFGAAQPCTAHCRVDPQAAPSSKKEL